MGKELGLELGVALGVHTELRCLGQSLNHKALQSALSHVSKNILASRLLYS